jgi:hypothetical protein
VISVLVAFRDAEGWRTRLWEAVRERLEVELPEAEVVVRSDDGTDPFNKCVALNRAARDATGDVFYILDADCYVPAAQVRGALEMLGDGWVKPWHRKLKLGKDVTERLLSQGLESFDKRRDRPEKVNTYFAAPPFLLAASTYWDVGGMDERYRGWGGEDSSFGRSLWKTGHGFASTVRGECLHLWHPIQGKEGRKSWPGQTEVLPNRHLDAEYNGARTEDQMREVIARRQT